MEVITDIKVMQEKLRQLNKDSVGLVQVKSVLHEGHAALIRRARKENIIVIVAKLIVQEEFISEEACKLYQEQISVNIGEEIKLASDSGADFFFAPPVESVYSNKNGARLQLGMPLARQLNGAFKEDYYEKRLNTTCILLNMLQPRRIYLSDKDPQLVLLTGELLKDLHYRTVLQIIPRLRGEDGLVLSSKNQLLWFDEKTQAVKIYDILKKAENAVAKGMVSCRKIKWHIENEMNALYLCQLEYVEVVETKRLTKIETIVDEAYIMVAVRAGKARICDYIKVVL